MSAAYLRSTQSLGVREAMAVADPAGANRRLIPVRVGETRGAEPFAERAVLDLARRDASAGCGGDPQGTRPFAATR